MTTARRRPNLTRWVVVEDTPDTLRLESQQAGGSAWWLYVVAGVLIGVFLLLAGASNEPDSPPILAALGPLFFIYWGLRMRTVHGGRIEVSKEDGGLLRVQRNRADSDGRITEVALASIERVLVKKRFLGWRLLIDLHSGPPVDVTPPDDMNVRTLKDTANVLAARLGVEVQVAL